MAVGPNQPDDVGAALQTYLSRRLGADVRFAEGPDEVTHGWSTYTYTFRLEGEGLEPPWQRPLVLRRFARDDQGAQAEREGAVQRFAAESGFPAPRPLAVEPSAEFLGAPFIVMERVPGIPMLDRIGANLGAAFRQFGRMGEVHASLHRLPVEGRSVPSSESSVDELIALFRQDIERYGLNGLAPGLRWLETHKGAVIPEEPSLCHNDFHPLNLMVDEEEGLGVIDWQQAGLGDRHHDVAGTVFIVRTPPLQPRHGAERVLGYFTRVLINPLLVRRYLARYREHLPVDPERLRYWQAVEAFGWLVRLAVWEHAGSLETGLKPDAAGRVADGFGKRVRRYFLARVKR